MAVSVVQSKEAHDNGGVSSLPVTMNSAPTVGNVVFVFVFHDGGTNTGTGAVAITGYTSLGSAFLTGTAAWAFRRITVGGDSATITATQSIGSLKGIVPVEVTGADTTTPEDAATSFSTEVSTTAPTMTVPALGTSGTMLLGAIHNAGGATTTKPASMTLLQTVTAALTSATVSSEQSDTTSSRDGTFSLSVDGAMACVRVMPTGTPPAPATVVLQQPLMGARLG